MDDFLKLIGPVMKFAGVIEIIAGLVLCFKGIDFIKFAVTFLVWIFFTSLLFGFCLNFGLISMTKGGSLGIIIGFLLGAGVISLLPGFIAYKYSSAGWDVATIGGLVGAIVLLLLVKGFWKKCPKGAFYGIGIAGLVLGAIIGQKLAKFVKSIGTAIIGAFLIVHGVGQFAGGFPAIFTSANNLKSQLGAAFFGYVAGMICFAVAGSWYQLNKCKNKEIAD